MSTPAGAPTTGTDECIDSLQICKSRLSLIPTRADPLVRSAVLSAEVVVGVIEPVLTDGAEDVQRKRVVERLGLVGHP